MNLGRSDDSCAETSARKRKYIYNNEKSNEGVTAKYKALEMSANKISAMDLYQPISFCGIKLKRNVKRRNMFAIFYTFFLVMVASGYLNV